MDNLDHQIAYKAGEQQRLRGTIQLYQQRVDAAPTRESELIALTRDYNTLQNLYTNLLAKKEDSQISANLERRQIGQQFKVIEPARLPEKPFSPNMPRIYLLGIAAGLGLGLLLAGLVAYFDTSLRTDDDVTESLGLPVLATVPLVASSSDRRWRQRRRYALAATAAIALVASIATLLWRANLLWR
jgi:capsular polysaccharide biosynthesis protein